MAAYHNLRELTVATFSDNTPAVAWGTKCPSPPRARRPTCSAPPSLHQCAHHYISQHFYIPGPANVLADIASRCFDLSDAALLATLNSRAPHSQPWQMLHLSPDMCSRLTTDLQWQRLAWPLSPACVLPRPILDPPFGYSSRTPWAWTRFCCLWTTRSPSSVSLPTGSAMAAPAEVVTWSTLNAYKTRSWLS